MAAVDTPRKMVRLLISDVGGSGGSDYIFDDDEIDGFLGIRGGSVYGASADALRSMAANEAMVSKRITYLGLSTDGPSVAAQLRLTAADFDTKADEEGDIDVIEMDLTPQTDRIMRRGSTF